MTYEEMKKALEAVGYTVKLKTARATKEAPRATKEAPRATKEAPRKLNAIGRPYGSGFGFDPKYRMKYHTPSISNRQGDVAGAKGTWLPTGDKLGRATWTRLCADAAQDAWERGLIDSDYGRPW